MSDSEHASRLYIQQLHPLGFGHPMYFPERPSNLSPELIKRGTSIGDVGIIKLDGSFQYAFNIFTPQTDVAINCFGVPVGFHALTLRGREIRIIPDKFSEKSQFQRGNAVHGGEKANASDGSATSAAGLKFGYQVVEPSSESALLVLPDGAMSEDYRRLADIKTYSKNNGLAWYEFVNGTLGLEAPNGSLHVVTGCDKTTAWGIATIAENSESKDSTLEFTAEFVATTASYSCSWITTDGSIRTRNSPNPEPGVKQPHNQCLFIRGFKITLNESVDQLVTLESMTAISYIHGLQSVGGASHQEGADDRIDDVELDPLVGPYHALDTINKYLLETNPQAQVAISHESDWWDLSPGPTLATEDEIIMRLASRTATIKSGGVFLAPRASTQSDTRPNEGSTTDVDHNCDRRQAQDQ